MTTTRQNATIIGIDSFIKTDKLINGVVIKPIPSFNVGRIRIVVKSGETAQVLSYNADLYEYTTEIGNKITDYEILNVANDEIRVYTFTSGTYMFTTQHGTLANDGCDRLEIIGDILVGHILSGGTSPLMSPDIAIPNNDDLINTLKRYNINTTKLYLTAVEFNGMDISEFAVFSQVDELYMQVCNGLIGDISSLASMTNLHIFNMFYAKGVAGDLANLFNGMKSNGRVGDGTDSTGCKVSYNPNFTVNGVAMQKSGNVIFDAQGNWDASDLFY